MNIDELIEQLKQLSISQEDALQTQREVGILIAKKSVAAEREACAKLCETTDDGTPYNQAEECAAAIRARGQA